MFTRLILAAAIVLSTLTIAAPRPAKAQICGHYIILGCYRQAIQAHNQLSRLGGHMAGGGAGSQVIDTNEYPNFRNGWFCVADGPYASKQQALGIAWKEVVPDAYVKNGC
jgi:hypothetical protein